MGDVVLCTAGRVVAVVVVPATAVVGETSTDVVVAPGAVVTVVELVELVDVVELVELLEAGLLVDVVVAPPPVVDDATVVDVVVVVASKPVPQAVNCASKSSFTLPAKTWPYDWVSLPRSSCPLPTQKRP